MEGSAQAAGEDFLKEEIVRDVGLRSILRLQHREGEANFANRAAHILTGKLDEVARTERPERKNDKGAEKKPIPLEALAGAVIYAKKDADIYLCLVHDVFGHWTLSKGHIDLAKNIEKELQKAIKEELGIKIDVKDHLGHTEYGTYDPEKGKIKKKVEYYLAETEYADVALQKSGGLDDCRWFKLADILDLNFYDDILPIVTKAINLLVKS